MGGKRLTTEIFINRSNIIHNNKYDYSKVNYITINEKVIIICPTHGDFLQKPSGHLNGEGCKNCFLDKTKYTLEEFIQESNIVHDHKYDYSKVILINLKTEVIIFCPIHGEFLQHPHNHLIGRGCKKCGIESRRYSLEEYIELARKTHGDKYQYLEYGGFGGMSKIICPIHGEFKQSSSDHLNHGCNQCAIEFRARSISLTQEDFLSRSIKIHGEKYDYSKVNYISQDIKIEIICKKHGSFWQKPSYHMMGCDCSKCANTGISKAETQWLDILNINEEFRQFVIKIDDKTVKVDGYDSETNTVYEYNGDFWHGNPLVFNPNDINNVNKQTFGDLYQKTIARENLIKSAGYNLIVKWETEIP